MDKNLVRILILFGLFLIASEVQASVVAEPRIYWTDSNNNGNAVSVISQATINGTGVNNLVTPPSLNPRFIALDLSQGKMYWTDVGTIKSANLDGSNVASLISGLPCPMGIGLDTAGRMIYWTDCVTNKIQRSSMDNPSVQDVITLSGSLRGLALDIPRNKMYWTNIATNTIQRADLNGNNLESLVSGVTFPHGISLDLSHDKLYWTEEDRIKRANLDGTGVETLSVSGHPRGIAVSAAEGKIYWSNFFPGKVLRANLDGKQVEELVASGLDTPWGLALSVCQPGNSKYSIKNYDPSRAYNGTTIFADNTDLPACAKIVEIDMCGNVLWEYQVNSVTSLPANLGCTPLFIQDKPAMVMDVEKLPNENILFVLRQYGIFEIDKQKTVVWCHLDSEASHDADRLPNGNTLYVRGWVEKGDKSVIEIKPDGSEVWSWDGLGQFPSVPNKAGLIGVEGWFHVNAVTRLEDGNTLISPRNLNQAIKVKSKFANQCNNASACNGDIIWSVNINSAIQNQSILPNPVPADYCIPPGSTPPADTPKLIFNTFGSPSCTGTAQGDCRRDCTLNANYPGYCVCTTPHDPEVQPNGNILFTHTTLHLAQEVRTPDSIPPASSNSKLDVWSWRPTDNFPAGTLSTPARDANRLPNGNTLFVSLNAIVEVAPNKIDNSKSDVVWMVQRGSPNEDPKFFKAERIGPDSSLSSFGSVNMYSNMLALCRIVGCPPILEPWKWNPNPNPDERFQYLVKKKGTTSARLKKIKREAASLVKQMKKTGASAQAKIERRAGELLENLKKLDPKWRK